MTGLYVDNGNLGHNTAVTQDVLYGLDGNDQLLSSEATLYAEGGRGNDFIGIVENPTGTGELFPTLHSRHSHTAPLSVMSAPPPGIGLPLAVPLMARKLPIVVSPMFSSLWPMKTRSPATNGDVLIPRFEA